MHPSLVATGSFLHMCLLDGCVDHTNPDNAGLFEVTAMLDTLWLPHCSLVSRADFWVLASKVVLERSAGVAGYTVPMRFGRTDAVTCVSGAVPSRLPGAEGQVDEIDRVFVHAMGLSRRDAVALIGAHSLGRAQRQFSGYEGPWTGNANRFDNTLYSGLINRPWDIQLKTDTHTEWRDGQQRLALNADMALVYSNFENFDVNSQRCGGNRFPGACDLSQLAGISQEYASDNTLFLTEFAEAFQRMTEVGYSEAELSISTSTTTIAPTTTTSTTPVPTTTPSPPPLSTTSAPTTTPSTTPAPTTTPSPPPQPPTSTIVSTPSPPPQSSSTMAPTPPPPSPPPPPRRMGDGRKKKGMNRRRALRGRSY